jgi:hypothetical protein
MRYFLAILAIIISYIILSGIIAGLIFKGNVSAAGLMTAFVMIPVARFLWKAITRKKEKEDE